ncbi:MAG: FHA domain-containing protein, partial [Actinobacteria bacterium]|nr:FHA domain-containing protein [Actinomycetota bacterium]
LKALASEHARKQGFQFGEVLEITLAASSGLVLGQLEVSSEAKKLDVAWIPVLEVSGVKHELSKSRTTVGRDSTADLQIGDNGLSRKHFEILWDGSRAAVRDLGSTNGTTVAGKKVDQLTISAGTVISAGRTDFLFNVIARSK